MREGGGGVLIVSLCYCFHIIELEFLSHEDQYPLPCGHPGRRYPYLASHSFWSDTVKPHNREELLIILTESVGAYLKEGACKRVSAYLKKWGCLLGNHTKQTKTTF